MPEFSEFLRGLRLEGNEVTLEDNSVDDEETLLECGDADLLEMGIKLGPRRVLAAVSKGGHAADAQRAPPTAIAPFIAQLKLKQDVHKKFLERLLQEEVDSIEYAAAHDPCLPRSLLETILGSHHLSLLVHTSLSLLARL